MRKKEYTEDNLYNFIEEESSWQITCSNCGNTEGGYGDGFYETANLFEKGWKATKQNVYCPTCAPKKLKLNS